MQTIIPRATYRLQFHAGFTFRDAAAIAPYLSELGVSHIYASPYLKARPGSTHGYDIIDHHLLNPELGTEEDFSAMVEAFAQGGLKQILDFVPNHMGVGGADNPLWLNVLEWGRDSKHAGWFDIDWEPDRKYLFNKLLVPILGDQYGKELEAGNIALQYDQATGSLAFWAYEKHKLPLSPFTYDKVLGHDNADLDRMGDLFSDLASWRPVAGERAGELKTQLRNLTESNPAAQIALEDNIKTLNTDWRSLDRLIDEQNWRPAFYGVAGDDINYRRFFNINDLAGFRMELPDVFQHAHSRIIPMIEAGILDGIRLDHVDGLTDPKQYFLNLRQAVSKPFYLVIEKILAGHEHLHSDWAVDGTTGYDFTNLVLGVLINAEAEEALSELYQSFTACNERLSTMVRDCKIRIMENEMASELNALGRDAGRLARQNPMTADFTRAILQRALKQIIASFPVYRTYIDTTGEQTDADKRDLDWSVSHARRGDPNIDASVFDFLSKVLSAEIVSSPANGFSRTSVLRFAMRVQQYSGPVMAKGLEDTAFYRYNRLIALNEVGGEPEHFGVAVGAFHKANAYRAKYWPHTMLATSTHDTKRGEDTRARLAVLSDMPDEWKRQVTSWTRLLRARRGDVEGTGAPDKNDEYFMYQLLVGSWPIELLAEPDSSQIDIYRDRLHFALEKSLREAKVHSTWTAPDTVYEEALKNLASEALKPESGFFSTFVPFACRVARFGALNSLSQLTIKLTVPGMPDIYQGCELWDLSLMDPDNRRPVDYDVRSDIVKSLRVQFEQDGSRKAFMGDLLVNWKDGRIKVAVTSLLLDLRFEKEQLFSDGGYSPLSFEGEFSNGAIGFMREFEEDQVAVIVSRSHVSRDECGWNDTSVTLPKGQWIDHLTGEHVFGGNIPLALLLSPLPVSVLTRISA